MKNGEYELVVAPDGYPGKRYRGRYAYEHRVRWWKKTGRNPDGTLVHHRNEKKRDNRPRNLEDMTPGDHVRRHHPRTMITYRCKHCQKKFVRRKGLSGVFCSRQCIGRHHGNGR